MKNLILLLRGFLISPAFLFTAGIIVTSILARQLPERWDDLASRFVRFLILYLIIWVMFQVREYRKDVAEYNSRLDVHRLEIMELLKKQDRDIEKTNMMAENLAKETARLARELAVETKATSKDLKEQMIAAADASRNAQRVANNVNEKIEHLNEQLLGQGEETVKHLSTIEETARDSKGNIETIKKTTTDSLHILEKNIAKKLVDGGQLDDMQATGDETNEMVKGMEREDKK